MHSETWLVHIAMEIEALNEEDAEEKATLLELSLENAGVEWIERISVESDDE